MLVLNHLENAVMNVDSIATLSVVKVDRKLDEGRTYSNYEIIATGKNAKEMTLYSVPANAENQDVVTRVYRNIIALMSDDIISTGPKKVYSTKSELVSMDIFNSNSGISDIAPYFPE